jgi:hypothetical protein
LQIHIDGTRVGKITGLLNVLLQIANKMGLKKTTTNAAAYINSGALLVTICATHLVSIIKAQWARF